MIDESLHAGFYERGAEAEDRGIEEFLRSCRKGNFLGLWYDPEDGELGWGNGTRRSEVAVDIPENVEEYVIYEMLRGEWQPVTITPSADAEALLESFLAKAEDAARNSQHPARRAVRG